MIAWESMAGMDKNESERSFLQKRELPLWISPERELSCLQGRVFPFSAISD